MAKARKTSKKTTAPNRVTINLFAPGMTLLHRAGLGGLAATLKALERRHRRGLLPDAAVPGGTPINGEYPWRIDEDELTLDFKEPDLASEFLAKLFAFGFGIKDKLIDLPGTYRNELTRAVRAELQTGLTLTFLQFGPHRKLATESPCMYDLDGDGIAEMTIRLRACASYLHQTGWQLLIEKSGKLRTKPIEAPSAFNPGGVVRHNKFNTQSKISNDPAQVLCLCFAAVGCLSLGVNRSTGVLVVPNVVDLTTFAASRPRMTPTTLRECRIAGASDAAFQAHLRLRGDQLMRRGASGVDHLYAMKLRPTQWNEKQKSRVAAVVLHHDMDGALRRFQVAMQCLPPRIPTTLNNVTKGKGKQKTTSQQSGWFWSDSIVRPLVAENLAAGRPWYRGFADLMIRLDPDTKRPLRDKLNFEKEGLFDMTNNIEWEDRTEGQLVKAVHEAIRRRYGAIAAENQKNSAARENRWKGEYDKWRLAFAGAKTPDRFRRALCDLFSRAGVNDCLQSDWSAVLPLVADAAQWELARDLSLFALASYRGKGADADTASEDADSNN